MPHAKPTIYLTASVYVTYQELGWHKEIIGERDAGWNGQK